MSEVLIRTLQLTRKFGSLSAVDEVSLDLYKGEVHAILGPNGAGKSTLVNLLSGDLPATTGKIVYQGSDITGMAAHEISHLGIGRSYQKTNIFLNLSCMENVWLAAQSRQPTSMRFFRSADNLQEVRGLAEESLQRCGLMSKMDWHAQLLSYGEQRQLEIGMMLATCPQLLLMDEPMAGMGKEESESLITLILELAKEFTILLIEHDMDAVFAVADRLTVMVNGRVLETGTVEQIRASKDVQDAYLGNDCEF